jgi:hypothetical protein
MTVEAGRILVEEIAPRLKMAVPCIKPVGCEDKEELVQDGLLMAAKMLCDLEARGKVVTPGNVAFYCILHLKSGRRSHSANRTDAYSSGCQLDGKCAVLSTETEIGFDPETMEPICLGEFLTCPQDDPASMALRNVDWQSFLDSHDYRYGVILQDMVEGKTALDTSRDTGETYHHVRQLKERLGLELREYLGEDAVADSLKVPVWMAGIHAGREKAACRVH